MPASSAATMETSVMVLTCDARQRARKPGLGAFAGM
jgi:hypothetical protein